MQLIIFPLICSVSFVVSKRIVMTTTGPVQGLGISSGGSEIEAFLGIPYAEPPVDNLRFRKPIPKMPWTSVYNASNKSPSCIQNGSKNYYDVDINNMAEDCLYINLWVPYSKTSDELKPVLIFIHGGAFNLGSGSMPLYDGTNLARMGDIIVANMNYRLGVLGFFSAFTEEADGNMGIYDQILAMKWIKENAKAFGGNPDNLVLMGESAGSMVAGAHLVSPLTKNFIKRVIMQGGSPTCPIFFDTGDRVHRMSQTLATSVSCANKTFTLRDHPSVVVECLKKLPVQSLISAEGLLKQKSPVTFTPRSGDAYMPKPPIELLKEGYFKDVEMLTGVNEEEGTLFLTVGAPQYFGVYGANRIQSMSRVLANHMIRLLSGIIEQNNTKEIANQYVNSVQNGTVDTYTEAIARVVGDYIITCNTLYQAEIHSLRNTVYFYKFSRRPSSTPLADWMKTTHFDELQYVFGNPLFKSFTLEEAAFSNRMMKRWIAFIKTGSPNPPGLTEWPKFTLQDQKYLELNDEDSLHSRPDDYRCEFWRSRYNAIIDDDVIAKIKNIKYRI